MHFHLDKVENFIGFAVEGARKGEMVRVRTRAIVTSDQDEFYSYVDDISGHFL